ncbi:MAG: SpoIID/LytB domain-containing protein [Pelotomaculum sp.]|uniref:Sporulation protein and related proteins n=1 Tax=Pelotomaculum thermopropionicum (strain DSM 13744 / JCM 10971 / SI) TaxID=370438 RepID=A5D3G4_PELTS|nr:SpoIID/LytB domain-containing protein [Pelotomaculum sp.]BAF59211.1 sporulation protein and related proteins [Pelotomaculum thermopropionicum SI]
MRITALISGLVFAFTASLIALVPAADASSPFVPCTVRVALTRQADTLSIKAGGNYQLVDKSTGKVISRLERNEALQASVRNNRLELKSGKKLFGPFSGPVLVQETVFHKWVKGGSGEKYEKYSADGLVVLNGSGRTVSLDEVAVPYVKSSGGTSALPGSGELNLLALTTGEGTRRYRGSVELQVEGGKIIAVNELNIEDYLRGVVPSEVYPDWPLEALKAQAVAARNYAMQQVEATRGQRFNLECTQYSQVYKGYDAETPATNRAVEETRGVVMLWRGSLIAAYFHSSSGGYTENSEDVWTSALPYIKGKADPYDKNSPHYNWQVQFTAGQLAARLKEAGYPFEKVTDIEELARTASGKRVEKIAVKGTDTSGKSLRVEISNADSVRMALGLKSALFTMKKTYDGGKNLKQVDITGSGFGHGLGLSQWGAYGMARQGYNYQDILKYYYTGINIVNNYGRTTS